MSTDWLETTGRFQSGFAELGRIEVRAVFPEMPAFFAALDAQFAALPELLAGRSTDARPPSAALEVDGAALSRLSAFDRAAVAVARKEMERVAELTAALVACARELAGDAVGDEAARVVPSTGRAARSTWLPVPEWDHLRRAAFVAATTGVGFVIWILFDPPGHSGWFQLSGTIALLVAAIPQMRASKLIAPVAVTSAICLAIYVLVMPRLSSFLGLGTLLFLCMFLNHYFLTGMARFFTTLAILNMLQIQNEQVYSFYVMVNVFLFLVMGFTFLFVMSYMLGSPRPEKTMLRMLDRFFRSAEFLMSRTRRRRRPRVARRPVENRVPPAPAAVDAGEARGVGHGRRPDAVSRHDARAASRPWSSACRPWSTASNSSWTRSGSGREAALARDLRDELATWHAGLEVLFGGWARHPEAEPVAALEQRLERQLAQLETRVAEVVNQGGRESSADAGEQFFRLLGGYRGVSEAALAYAGVAQSINWSEWREERFS